MARRSRPTGATPAVRALDGAGITYRLREYEHDPRSNAYGLEAALALGEPPERVFKTLLVRTDPSASKGLVVAIVPVAEHLDLKALARAVGAKKAVMAEPVDAERATGYVVGGISPLGQRQSLPTVLDESALAHGVILVSGGQRGLDVELAPSDLVALTRACTSAIARR